MVISCKSIFSTLPVIRYELYIRESVFVVKTNLIKTILLILKNHFLYQYKVLTCISGVDYPENKLRFQVVYELLSLKYNSRLRLKILTNELIPIDTVEKIYSTATWFESEIWDMFGVFFLDQRNLTRLLTDYGFKGHPLRKDFPLSGFLETKFNVPKRRIGYYNVELSQEYRVFKSSSPWLEKNIKNVSLCINS